MRRPLDLEQSEPGAGAAVSAVSQEHPLSAGLWLPASILVIVILPDLLARSWRQESPRLPSTSPNRLPPTPWIIQTSCCKPNHSGTLDWDGGEPQAFDPHSTTPSTAGERPTKQQWMVVRDRGPIEGGKGMLPLLPFTSSVLDAPQQYGNCSDSISAGDGVVRVSWLAAFPGVEQERRGCCENGRSWGVPANKPQGWHQGLGVSDLTTFLKFQGNFPYPKAQSGLKPLSHVGNQQLSVRHNDRDSLWDKQERQTTLLTPLVRATALVFPGGATPRCKPVRQCDKVSQSSVPTKVPERNNSARGTRRAMLLIGIEC
ncbi:unnamed protein product [Pleuronectes platessa]|uniref:Uncharacterized protein n=1 Tax=Pleuronectes platessa TaxID=8262 RepID=A0A9N7V0P0_PLEPL|nr:unnamed protein product [Pleuronectes platessa]